MPKSSTLLCAFKDMSLNPSSAESNSQSEVVLKDLRQYLSLERLLLARETLSLAQILSQATKSLLVRLCELKTQEQQSLVNILFAGLKDQRGDVKFACGIALTKIIRYMKRIYTDENMQFEIQSEVDRIMLSVLSSMKLSAKLSVPVPVDVLEAFKVAAETGQVRVVQSLLPSLEQRLKNHDLSWPQEKDLFYTLWMAIFNFPIKSIDRIIKSLGIHWHLKLIIRASDDDCRTMLMVASDYGELKLIRCLLKGIPEKEKCEAIMRNCYLGKTSLMRAAEEGYNHVVEFFLKELGPQRQYDAVNFTALGKGAALFLAAESGHYKVVETLLKGLSQAEMDRVILKNGNTKRSAFYIASQNGCNRVVRIFLKCLSQEAKVKAILQEQISMPQIGWTSLHISVENGHVAIVDMLCQYLTPAQVIKEDLKSYHIGFSILRHSCKDPNPAMIGVFLSMTDFVKHITSSYEGVALLESAIEKGNIATAGRIAYFMFEKDSGTTVFKEKSHDETYRRVLYVARLYQEIQKAQRLPEYFMKIVISYLDDGSMKASESSLTTTEKSFEKNHSTALTPALLNFTNISRLGSNASSRLTKAIGPP